LESLHATHQFFDSHLELTQNFHGLFLPKMRIMIGQVHVGQAYLLFTSLPVWGSGAEALQPVILY
jgi:hypothetical protein